MDSTNIITITISSLALIGSLLTYLIHTKRLNEQQKQINQYQLKSLKEEEENKKKAFIQCEQIENPNRGKLDYLIIKNTGNSPAMNVNYIMDDSDCFTHEDNLFPYPKLLPNQTIEIYFYSDRRCNKTITFTWDDDFKEGRSTEQVLYI
ncbi:MAG: hypothetical protein ACRCUJ_07765 [Phocaeicola sp.]